MISPTLIESSIIFLPIKFTHLLYSVFSSSNLKYITWFNRLIIADLFFVIRKKLHKRLQQGQQLYQRHRCKYHLTVLQTVLQTALQALLQTVLQTVLKALLWTALQTVLQNVMWKVLCNISSFLFFMSAASLWPCATRLGLFSLTMTNLSFVSTSFSNCIVLRSALSFAYEINMALASLFRFFGMTK